MTRVSYPRMLTAGSREQAVQVDARQVAVEGAEQPASLAVTSPSWASSSPDLTAWHHSWNGCEVFYFSRKTLLSSLSLGCSQAAGEKSASGAGEQLS